MLTLRPAAERGQADHGWLKTAHSFSFAGYYDPRHMGFHSLLVINEDTIQGGGGFPTHSHQDMEIITYVLQGQLEHKDSMGTGSVIKAGDVQYMAAGTGVAHSEFNHSQTKPVHLLQIWIVPNKGNVHPRYNQAHFTRADKLNQLRAIVGGESLLEIHQDAEVYASVLEDHKTLQHKFESNRVGWLQLISGEMSVSDQKLTAGDGLAVEDESVIKITATSTEPAEFLLFDLAKV